MKFKRIGIDIAKNIFQLHGTNEREQVVLKKKLSRHEFLKYLYTKVNVDATLAMESCAGSHHWARELRSYGFTVLLLPAQYVKPYVKRNKNDANDAEAITEAAGRPNMPTVVIKTVEQQDMQALHRVRSEWVKQRTATANQIRGLVAEYGVVAAQSLGALKSAIPLWLDEAQSQLSVPFRRLLQSLNEHLKMIEENIRFVEKELKQLASDSPTMTHLQSLPGMGLLTATALVAAIGDGRQFKNGRCLSAWLGLTPRQHSSGGKDVLLGISKAGDGYLRTLFTHGARSVVNTASKRPGKLTNWIMDLRLRRHHNAVVTAVANKNARIAWAMLTKGEKFNPDFG